MPGDPREPSEGREPSDADYAALLAFRDGLRRFLRFSEDRAKAAGLTAAQHQLLLAVRGHGTPPSVGEVADHLLLRHHSAVELVDRAVQNGLVQRTTDLTDQRVVRLSLTDAGREKLASLSADHLRELAQMRESFSVLRRLEDDEPAAT